MATGTSRMPACRGAQSVAGIIEQLVEPDGGMLNFDKEIAFEQKEELGDYLCVVLTAKCEEAH